MKKKIFETVCMLLLLLVVISGCGGNENVGEYQIYYMSIDLTKIVPKSMDLESSSGEDVAAMMLECLQNDPGETDLRRTIPESIKVGKPQFDRGQVTIDLSGKYYDLGVAEQVLTRAAIVKTLTQVKECKRVVFTVKGEPMVNADGKEVKAMNKDSFVENPGKQINSSSSTVLTLYFANKAGDKLEKEECEVHYSSNISLDKLIMTKLIEGPDNSELQATLPAGTKIVMISVADGICYVNLDETFRNDQNNEISEQVVLYSIVDSLTELPEVDKVQISINGDSKGSLRYNCALSELYERDESLIVRKYEVIQDTTEE